MGIGNLLLSSGRSMMVSCLTLQITIHLLHLLFFWEIVAPLLSEHSAAAIEASMAQFEFPLHSPESVTLPHCLSNSLKAPDMAMAPLTPVPATMHTTVLYLEGSAVVKYGPSSRKEIATGLVAFDLASVPIAVSF